MPASSAKVKRFFANTAVSMRNIWAIMSKEISSFFTTSIGYTVILGYVLTTSLFFILIVNILRNEGSIPPTYRPLTMFYSTSVILFVFMFLSSILSMRLFAYEKETGTIEMLLTVPVSDGEVVIGKYLATVVFYLLCISPSLINSLVLFRPEIAHNLFGNIIFPTLVFLPLLLFAFSFVSVKHNIGVIVGLLVGALIVIILLRGLELDKITQKVAYIPAEKIDFDNDGMSDLWETHFGLDPTRENDVEDPDKDGDTNIEEFTYGTSPVDPDDNITSLVRTYVPKKNVLGKGEEDRDKDGIPDRYEQWLGLSSDNPHDASEDYDRDGDSNLREWEYGTDLRDSKSNLKSIYIAAISRVNIIENKYIDNDNDGMPDRWESTYNLSIHEDNGGVDTDNDGYSNADEYHYRTDPTDRESIPRLSESKAWFLHLLSYLLALVLFLLLSFPYGAKREANITLALKYAGIAGIFLILLIVAIFLTIDIKTDEMYSGFMFWGFTVLFMTITAILSRLSLVSRSKLNAASIAVFLFLTFRLFWCFSIAEKAASQPDVGTTLSGYLGGGLVGALFIAIGMFFSALFKDQINAAVVTFAFLLIVFLSSFLPSMLPALEHWQPLFDHYNFRRFLIQCADGNLYTGNMAFVLSTILLFMFFTVKVLGVRKWR